VVALNRAFSQLSATFKAFMQESPEGKAAKALGGLQHMVDDVLPEQLSALASKYNSSSSYSAAVHPALHSS